MAMSLQSLVGRVPNYQDFKIEEIRAKGGTVISYRDRENGKALETLDKLINIYTFKPYLKHLKVLKTDMIPMGVNKGQVLVQIGYPNVGTDITELQALKSFIEDMENSTDKFAKDLYLTNPTIVKESIRILGRTPII